MIDMQGGPLLPVLMEHGSAQRQSLELVNKELLLVRVWMKGAMYRVAFGEEGRRGEVYEQLDFEQMLALLREEQVVLTEGWLPLPREEP